MFVKEPVNFVSCKIEIDAKPKNKIRLHIVYYLFL